MIGLSPFAQDVGFALRMLRRMPGFTATIILTLALGIGMTAAVFTVFNTVLLKPLSYPNPERLVSVSTVEPDSPHTVEIVLEPHFTAWKAQSSTFEHLVAYDMSDEPVILDGQGATVVSPGQPYEHVARPAVLPHIDERLLDDADNLHRRRR